MRFGRRVDIHRAARWFDEKPPQYQAEHDAQPAKDDEREPPPVVLSDEAGEKAPANRADVNARLMQPHRSRPRVSPVVVADERHRCGEIEGLAQPLCGTPEEQMPERS